MQRVLERVLRSINLHVHAAAAGTSLVLDLHELDRVHEVRARRHLVQPLRAVDRDERGQSGEEAEAAHELQQSIVHVRGVEVEARFRGDAVVSDGGVVF